MHFTMISAFIKTNLTSILQQYNVIIMRYFVNERALVFCSVFGPKTIFLIETEKDIRALSEKSDK